MAAGSLIRLSAGYCQLNICSHASCCWLLINLVLLLAFMFPVQQYKAHVHRKTCSKNLIHYKVPIRCRTLLKHFSSCCTSSEVPACSTYIHALLSFGPVGQPAIQSMAAATFSIINSYRLRTINSTTTTFIAVADHHNCSWPWEALLLCEWQCQAFI